MTAGSPSVASSARRLLKPFVALDLKRTSSAIAWFSLLIGSVVGVTPADATDDPGVGRPVHARASATRDELYAAVRAYAANAGIPAFARKYGMKCTACHLAVPLLNSYGQAFRDNGYRMKNGTLIEAM